VLGNIQRNIWVSSWSVRAVVDVKGLGGLKIAWKQSVW
jgi:hypothetical protein